MTHRTPRSWSLMAIAVVVAGGCVVAFWPAAAPPSLDAGGGQVPDAWGEPAAGVGAPTPQRRADVRVRLVDAATRRPLVNVRILGDSGAGEVRMRTNSEGEFPFTAGLLRLWPEDEGLFDPVQVELPGGTRTLELACRFRVRVSGCEGATVALHELLSGSDAPPDPAAALGGLRVGPVLAQWRVPGSFLWSSTDRPLVLVVERATIDPAHAVWAGASVAEGDQQRVTPPASVGPARVSRVIHGHPGSSHDFTVAPEPVAVRLDYVLVDRASGGGREAGAVELMAVRSFGDGHRMVGSAERRGIVAGATVVTFEAVPAGEYVVRSAVRRDRGGGQACVCLAWQIVELGGAQHTVTERDGAGGAELWFTGDTTPLMVVHVEDGVRNGIPVSYPAFDLAGAALVQGLHGPNGSLRIYDRTIEDAERYAFDLGLRSVLDLRK
jgi:hypothetical protein